jgi:hypothetical protein
MYFKNLFSKGLLNYERALYIKTTKGYSPPISIEKLTEEAIA